MGLGRMHNTIARVVVALVSAVVSAQSPSPTADNGVVFVGAGDMVTDKGRPYFEYFGENAGPSGLGYYSYDLGAWHIISLNSAAPARNKSPQMKWLLEDLAAHPADCTLAYWHIARFSS